MTLKQIEELADLVVGKVTMPSHAFAKDMCVGSSYTCSNNHEPNDCSSSDQVICVATSEFHCSINNNNFTCPTGTFGGCSVSGAYTPS